MTDINIIHEKTNISMKTLRKLAKFGYLKADVQHPMLIKSVVNLEKGNRLTALQLLWLHKNPKDWKSLNENHKFTIQEELDVLGDFVSEGAPWHVAAELEIASKRDKQGVTTIATWLKRHIDHAAIFQKGAEKPHTYFAIRLLVNVPENRLDVMHKVLSAAIWRCRQSDILTNYWRIDENGRTWYFKPKIKSLDL